MTDELAFVYLRESVLSCEAKCTDGSDEKQMWKQKCDLTGSLISDHCWCPHHFLFHLKTWRSGWQVFTHAAPFWTLVCHLSATPALPSVFVLTKEDEEIWFTLNYASIWMPEAFHWHLPWRFTFLFFLTRKPLAFRDVNVAFCQFNLDEGRRTFSISEFAAVFCPLLTFMETEHVFVGINRGTFTCRRDAALLNLWMKSGDTPPESSLPMA